ncbi:hypothetical protein FGW37_10000 [Streptomyces rectiverticillatus]|uniref:hypothetical protein n=1 Tax=Streptomyces rectiverticillatus TaxID=173860 RepID=UPI0015C388A0|nr:hypothetical protein [Streptomyces rectiverticillatus]QLE71892.1 hypothetical protein FGW37_10000 [Streptomyces rectiverticillatus]
MSAAEQSTGEAMPRPERTPDALRLALARIAPHRLAEMERQKNEAFQLAAQNNSLGPIHGWMTIWAGEVEIERRPDLLARRRAAELTVQSLDRDDPAWLAAMDELQAVLTEAREAAG